MRTYLTLEDGTVPTGTSIGSECEAISEIVFSTSMTGYLEVLTDLPYAGQAVVMTYPLIGNYGICHQDMESVKPWPDGYIVRGLSRTLSNFRSEDTIQNFLREHDIPGIYSIDTRALTKILREKGTTGGMITTRKYTDFSEPIKRMKEYAVTGVVLKTTTKKTYVLPGNGKKVVLMDYGAKRNIARSLNQGGCEVTVYPADTPAREVLAGEPDGITLSDGPGDPKENTVIIEEAKVLYKSDVPILAICLGHQFMVLASGMDTHEPKYGYRGGNYPVRDLETGGVYISSWNYGYVVDMDNLDPSVAVPAFVNVNDSTNEGLKYVGENTFTMQYYPEVCPGPLDSGYLFDRFLKMMEANDWCQGILISKKYWCLAPDPLSSDRRQNSIMQASRPAVP